MIAITHTPEEGTVARGVATDEAPADILTGAGWLWSGRLYAWHLPGSHATVADIPLIEATVTQLRQAGFKVSLVIDDERTPAPYSEKFVRRQIERLEANLLKIDRQLDRYFRRVEAAGGKTSATTDVWAIQMLLRRIDVTEQLRYLREVSDEMPAGHSPETVRKGDYVRISGHWRKVARVNQKSVTVETDHSGTGRAPYYDITGHRPAEASDEPTP